MRRKKDGTLGYITKRRLNNEHRYIESRLRWAKQDRNEGLIVRLRAMYHAVPGAIEEANEGRRRVNALALQKLDGQCGNALARRGIDTKIGAERLCVDFHVSHNSIEPIMAWFAPPWFTEMAHKMGNRRDFYRQMDRLKKEGGDAIDEALGLLILGEI